MTARKLSLIAAAALAACRPDAVEPSLEEAPALGAPEPASSLIATPLDRAATGYTNEMQAARLVRESDDLGIAHIGPGAPEEPAPAAPPLTKAEKRARLERLREMRRQITLARRGIDTARDKSVVLTGETAALIAGRSSGAIVGPAQDSPGVWSGAYGGAVEAGERVVSDAAAWTELWSRLSRDAPPSVDFGTTRIAAVFVGARPSAGFQARLVGLAAEDGRWLVKWLEEGPGETAADGETAPYLLVSVPKDARAIRWEKIRPKAN